MLVKKAFSDDELRDVFSLRYKVYCLERGYEEAEDYPSRLEIDQYDPYSIHVIAYVNSVPAGTARIILQNPLGLPVEKYCNIDVSKICSNKSAMEISRLAVSSEALEKTSSSRGRLTLALISELYRTARDLSIDYYFAAMRPGLERLMKRCGMTFLRAGEPVEYHGIRTPYYGLVEETGREVFSKRANMIGLEPLHVSSSLS